MKRKLTPKQRKFADEYVISGNATQAAIDAGYSKRSARQVGANNMTKHDIKKYIDDRMAEIESKKVMDAREAVELLTSIARGETTEVVYVPTIDGQVVAEDKPADLKTTIIAVKELLKRYPGDDKLVKAQIRKAEAEADIVRWKAKQLTGDTGTDKTVLVDDMEDVNDDS